MTIELETDVRKQAVLPVQQLPQLNEVAPAPRSLLDSALRVQNTVISAGRALGFELEKQQTRVRRQASGVLAEPHGYNPMRDIAGYERYANAFRDVESAEETYAIKRRIDQELEDRRILETGGAEGVVAQIAAGLVDPLMLIPVGGQVMRSARLGEEMARAAGKAALVGGSVAAGAEAVLQGTQETRTAQESAIAIGASSFLSGLLGAAAPLVREAMGSLGERTARDLVLPPPGTKDMLAPGGIPITMDDMVTSGSAGAMRVREMEAKLKGALGVEKLVGFASPILRTVMSSSGATRRTAVELAETPFYLTQNAKGEATPLAAETRVKMWQRPVAESMQELDRQFQHFRQEGGALSFKAFKEEVGRALRRNDQHPIPEVQTTAQAFRRKLFNPSKDHAIRVGLLPEDVKVIGADSYLTRVYNTQMISAQRPEFVDTVSSWLKRSQGGDDLELRALAEDITDHIVAAPDGRVLYEAVPIHRGPTQARVLDIPDEMIEKFLESDIELITRFYARSIIPDIELARSFGSPNMRDTLAGVRDDYQKLIAQASNEGERSKLAKQRDADIEDLAAMRDRLRGTYAAPADPNGFFVRGARFTRNWNFLSLMGAMTESSIPDLARPVMVHGVLATLRDGVLPMVANFRKFRLAADEAKRAGAALDMVLGSRAMELADIGDVYGRHTAVERGMQALVERYGKWTLMNSWNASLKQFSSVITQHEILRAAVRGSAMDSRQVEKMAMSGINQELAVRIGEQFRKHGEEGVVWLANTQKWTDRDAIAAFRGAVVKDVDRTIITPGIGDRPLWMSTELGKVVGQFKTFTMTSTQRVLLAGLQQRDAAVLNGTLLSIGLGMGVYYLKSLAAGKDTSPDAAVWVREGVDRSGILGWLYEAGNISEKFTKGLVGWKALTGGDQASRYASRGVFGALFGPSVGHVEDLAKATGAAVTGDFNESDVRALRRLVPYQNLFYIRWLFDRAQKSTGEALGAP